MELVRQEALAAREALAQLTDARVDAGLDRVVELLSERAESILAANAADLDAADVDEGARDRLRLDEGRLGAIADGVRATRALPPLEREVRTWTLENGLMVSERLIPVGVVGANFEARPNVAVDIATQVLKSGNAVVLRTGSAALRTVTELVDTVLRPALGVAVGRRMRVQDAAALRVRERAHAVLRGAPRERCGRPTAAAQDDERDQIRQRHERLRALVAGRSHEADRVAEPGAQDRVDELGHGAQCG